MFTNDLFSSLPTDNPDAEQAYALYWAIATSENNKLAVSTGPVYRFVRDLMIRAIMKDYALTLSQVAWLYKEVLPEGPGWGTLRSMVDYGREQMFGLVRMADNAANCLGHNDGIHAIDCPLRPTWS